MTKTQRLNKNLDTIRDKLKTQFPTLSVLIDVDGDSEMEFYPAEFAEDLPVGMTFWRTAGDDRENLVLRSPISKLLNDKGCQEFENRARKIITAWLEA